MLMKIRASQSSSNPGAYLFQAQTRQDHCDYMLNELIQKQGEIERGINDGDLVLSRDEKRALDRMKNSYKLENGRVVSGCLWKVGEPSYPNNYNYGISRFLSLERGKILQDQQTKQDYTDQIMSWVEKGFVRKVPKEERRPAIAYYLPTFPVIQPHRDTTKMRVVIDAKAKYNNKSLNDGILAGPKLIPDLATVLLRYRGRPIAVMADVSEMFLQIIMAKEDCKYHRFFYRVHPDDEIEEFEFLVHPFGNAGSPTVAIHAVQKRAKEIFDEKTDWRVLEVVNESTMVDDNIDSFDTVEEAIEISDKLKDLYKSLNMLIRKWASNSREFMNGIPDGERARNFDFNASGVMDLPTLKALGVIWSAEEDAFSFLPREPLTNNWTMRAILKEYARVYDPLGFIVPFVIMARTIFQDCWARKMDWDQPLESDQVARWQKWLDCLPLLDRVKVQRCLRPNILDIEKSTIHIFSDASHKAYAAVAYVRNEYKDGSVNVKWAFARARVAPNKKITIPRSELMGAVLATEVAKTLWKALKLDKSVTTFWCDSKNVLAWIRTSSKNLQEFVANRVTVIQNASEEVSWRWVPTEMNPGDVPSRGMAIQELLDCSLWWDGPEFLGKSESDWPIEINPELDEVGRLEIKKNCVESAHFLTKFTSGKLLDLARLNNWDKLVRLVAIFGKAMKEFIRAKQKGQLKIKNLTEITSLMPIDYDRAEKFIVKKVQDEAFIEILEQIEKNGKVLPSNSLVSLRPFLDEEGILRVGGRLKDMSRLQFDQRCPQLLPKRHPISETVARHYHEKILEHVGGPMHTLSELNEKFWIVAGRQMIKEIINKCIICRKQKTIPILQQEGGMPSMRVPEAGTRSFQKTIVDAAGPYIVRKGRGRPREKRYLIIFSCLSYHGIHTEISTSLDTETFLMAFERFVARRGRPDFVRSDNGGNFRKGDKEIRDLLQKINEEHLKKKYPMIKWNWSAPICPHQNGSIERMVKSMKKGLDVVITPGLLTDEKLVTLATRVEGIINTRPLTYQGSVNDLAPLTPADFFAGTSKIELVPILGQNKTYRTMWEDVQEILRQFWGRFMKEFVPQLHELNKWTRPAKNVGIGDVVAVLERDEYGRWPLARIVDTITDKDGAIRRVDIKMADGRRFERHIKNLMLLLKNEKPPCAEGTYTKSDKNACDITSSNA